MRPLPAFAAVCILNKKSINCYKVYEIIQSIFILNRIILSNKG